jgi:ribose transport system permease protein
VHALLGLLERGGLAILLVALVVFFTIDPVTGDVFRSSANVRNILANQSVTGLIALAMVVPLVCGSFDVSAAAIAGLANVTAAALIGTHGWPVVLGIAGAMAVALAAGAINGFLVAALKLTAFVVTLGTFTLIGGLLLWYTEGQTITTGIPASLSNWGSFDYVGIPRPFWLLMAFGLLAWYVLMQLPFGRRLASIGSNERAARLVGIRVDRHVFLAFIASSTLAGAAGVLLTSRSGGADPTAGQAYLFPALAAVFLGATTIRPGAYNVWGTLIGVFLVAVAINGFTLLGAESWVTPVFNGAALVAAVALSTLLGRRRAPAAETPASTPVQRGDPKATTAVT